MRGQTYVILAIVVVIIVAVFAVINVDPVEVNYLFGSGEAPLILVILFSVLMGGIMTASVGLIKMLRLQREHRSLLAEKSQMEDTLRSHDLLDGESSERHNDNPDENNNNQ